LEWLGFVWDLKIGSVEIPDRKMAHFKEKLNYIELDILEKKSGFKQHQPSSKYTIMG
jgi:hypothetical protein